MKKIVILFSIIAMGCADNSFVYKKWNLRIDTSGQEFLTSNVEKKDTILNSNYLEFPLRKTDSKIRVYDKYIGQKELEIGAVLDTLRSSLEKGYEILSSSTEPDAHGQLYSFVVENENNHLSPNLNNRVCYYFHLVNIGGENLLITSISSLGMLKEVENEVGKLLKGMKPIEG